jgi:hypothetical protein
MEVAEVRKRVLSTIERAKQRAGERRARTDEAARAYSTFLDTIAVPMFRQVANVLRAESYPFGVFTPSGSVKLVSDRTAEDSIEILLDTTGDEPRVMGHTTRSRGGGVLESERPVGDPATLSEADLLEFLMKELEALVGR